MNRPIVTHTRSSRGDSSSRPLRLQRIRRPGGPVRKEESKSSISRNGSGRSILFHQKSDGDLSNYQFSIDPSLMPKEGEGENPAACDREADMDTVGDESLYTTARTLRRSDSPNLNWEEAQAMFMRDRERKMDMAGSNNSIPTSLVIGGGSAGVSKLNMNSMRSIMSLDPTEEESQEGNQSSQEHHVNEPASPIQVKTIPEEKKKRGFFKKLFKSLFGSSSRSLRSSNLNKKTNYRQSLTKTPTELWRSTPTGSKHKRSNTGTPIGNGSGHSGHRHHRHQSAPPKLEPQDLWAPEQAAQRGIPTARLRVSTNGVRVWENASGRFLPFNAAEC